MLIISFYHIVRTIYVHTYTYYVRSLRFSTHFHDDSVFRLEVVSLSHSIHFLLQWVYDLIA